MDVYIDLPHLRSFAKGGGHPAHPDCVSMLRDNFNLLFTFDKDCIDREKKEARASILTLLKTFTRNRGTKKIEWAVNSPDLSDYSKASVEHLTSVYWSDDVPVEEQEKGCLLVSPVGSEVKTLLSLFIKNKPSATEHFPTRNMTDWGVIADNASPCTDIIIVDPYLFGQSDVYYAPNAFKIVEQLAQFANGWTPNVVIFSLKDYKDTVIPVNMVLGQLKKHIKDNMGLDINVTFVVLPKKEEHDRDIYTNYKTFNSGDSFNYFDGNGKLITRGRNFYVKSHSDSDNYDTLLSTLIELQTIVDRQINGIGSVYGDKISNFLKFYK